MLTGFMLRLGFWCTDYEDFLLVLGLTRTISYTPAGPDPARKCLAPGQSPGRPVRRA